MTVKLTQKQPHVRILISSKKLPDGRLVSSSVVLEPEVPKYVDDDVWAAIKEGSHHAHPQTGKRTNTIDLLVAQKHLEVEEGATAPDESGAGGSSKVTRGEVPPSHAVSLPGQGGEDNTRRDDAEGKGKRK